MNRIQDIRQNTVCNFIVAGLIEAPVECNVILPELFEQCLIRVGFPGMNQLFVQLLDIGQNDVGLFEIFFSTTMGGQDKNLRLRAEYDNFRKRSARERDNIYADVKADTLKKLLPIFDNLERALRQETADEAYKKGVEMTMTQFLEALNALGVTPIEAVGQKFDPNEHNAVMHMEDPDKGEGEIVQEFQKGFKMGDRVIRFSMVQVAN